jgi:hypothetical protein
MKCPRCKKETAFLWTEDGTPDPGRDVSIEIKCGGKCAGNINDCISNDPVHIADIRIDIIVKRNSINYDE